MKIVLVLISSLFIISCSNNSGAEKKLNTNANGPTDSLIKKTISIVDTVGIQGIVDFPPLLTLSIRDTATIEDISFRLGRAFGAIQEDIKEHKLEIAGSPGGIYYTNDPKHLLFECVIPIKKEPNGKTKRSDVITLEPIKALLYNYYGPYNQLPAAYEKIKKYMDENKLEQTGAAREFYISDPEQEKDPSKWLSKIYIPVK